MIIAKIRFTLESLNDKCECEDCHDAHVAAVKARLDEAERPVEVAR